MRKERLQGPWDQPPKLLRSNPNFGQNGQEPRASQIEKFQSRLKFSIETRWSPRTRMPTLPYILISNIVWPHHITQWLLDIFFHDCAMNDSSAKQRAALHLDSHGRSICKKNSTHHIIFFYQLLVCREHVYNYHNPKLQMEQPNGVDMCLFQDSNTPGSRPPGDGTPQSAGITGRHRGKDRRLTSLLLDTDHSHRDLLRRLQYNCGDTDHSHRHLLCKHQYNGGATDHAHRHLLCKHEYNGGATDQAHRHLLCRHQYNCGDTDHSHRHLLCKHQYNCGETNHSHRHLLCRH